MHKHEANTAMKVLFIISLLIIFVTGASIIQDISEMFNGHDGITGYAVVGSNVTILQGQWGIVSKNTLNDVLWRSGGKTITQIKGGNTNPENYFSAWNGGAFDPLTKKLWIAAQGGDADGADNGAYSFDITTGLWSLVISPTPDLIPALPQTGTWLYVDTPGTYGPVGKAYPQSRHTYGGSINIPGVGVWIGGGVAWHPYSITQADIARSWHATQSGWDGPFDRVGSYDEGRWGAWDSIKSRVLFQDNSRLRAYDPMKPSGSRVVVIDDGSQPSDSRNRFCSGAFDSKRNRLVGACVLSTFTGTPTLEGFNLSLSPTKRQTFLSSAPWPTWTTAPGFIYDPVSDKYVLWPNGGAKLYIIDPTTFTVTTIVGGGIDPGLPASPYAGTWGRFAYVPGDDLYLLAHKVTGSVYAFRPDRSGTPTPPAPVLTFSASPITIASGQSSALSWAASDATSCTASGAWSGSKATTGSQMVSPIVTSTYTLACTGSGGSTVQSIIVTVTTMPSSLQLQVNDVLVNVITPSSNDLTKTFPVGQMFDVIGSLIDISGDNSVNVSNMTVEVWLNSKKIASIPLPCEKTGISIFCRDGIWNTIGVPTGRNVYTFKQTGNDALGNSFSKADNLSLDFRTVDSTLCKELLPDHNMPTADRANIIFVGFGYQNVTGKTPKDALEYVAKNVIDIYGQNKGLFSVEPFKSNKNKFNFWYINKLGSVENCKSISGECPIESTLPFAENCIVPNKYIVALVDNNTAASGAGGRYATLSATVPNSDFDKNNSGELFVHEFGGHAFGDLRDEYIVFFEKMVDYETSNSSFTGGKNCYAGPKHTVVEALENAPWKYLIGNGCGQPGIIDCTPQNSNYYIEIGIFEGCAKDGLGVFRPTRVSIMGGDPKYQPPYPYSFGLWNEKLIQDKLNKFIGSTVPPPPLPDTQKPTVSITSPSSGATVSNTTSITATASDNIGVVGVQFKLDGTNLGSEDTTSPYSVSWDTKTTTNGAHTLTATARDAAGNVATNSVRVTVSNSVDSTPSQIDIPTGTFMAVQLPYRGQGIGNNKHVTMAWNPLDGRLYSFGGDWSDSDFPESQSYSQSMFSLSIKEKWDGKTNTAAGWRREQRYCRADGTIQPKHPDFVGWTWDSKRNVFWMVPGVMEIASTANCAGETGARVSDPLFLLNHLMTWNPVTKQWTDQGTDIGPTWAETWKSHYDNESDSLIRFGFDGGSGAVVNIFNIPTKTWSKFGLGQNALGNDIRINKEGSDIDLVKREIYTVDGCKGRLHRYNIATKKMTDLGAVPGGSIFSCTTTNDAYVAWDSIHKVLFFWRIDKNSLHVYNPTNASWENISTISSPSGITPNVRHAFVFDPGQNVLVMVGSTDPANTNMYFFRYAPGVGVSITPPSADTTAPTTSITSHASGSTVSGTITIIASASDNVGVTEVDLWKNGVPFATDTVAPYSFTWDTTGNTNGLYTLQTKAFDAAGNIGSSSAITVTVNNLLSNITLSFSASQTSVDAGSPVTLTWSAVNATSCTASGAWSGAKAASGSQTVNPTSTSTYTLTCAGAGGSVNKSVTITVNAPSIAGDINGDKKVDILDVVLVASYFGKATFDSRADAAPPFGTIDIFDVMVVVINWGRTY